MQKNEIMKLDRLFEKARREPAPESPSDFTARVLRALPDRDLTVMPALSLVDQLNALFPRLALASALFLALCLGTEFLGSGFGQSDLASGLTQLSDQWLFTTKGF
jgi:hypothetical protein